MLAIFKVAGDLYDKFVGFASDIDELGSRIEQTGHSFDFAKGKLVTGRGDLTGPVENFRDLVALYTLAALRAALPFEFSDERLQPSSYILYSSSPECGVFLLR
jgi:DNA anti-recombination protein RmuC